METRVSWLDRLAYAVLSAVLIVAGMLITQVGTAGMESTPSLWKSRSSAFFESANRRAIHRSGKNAWSFFKTAWRIHIDSQV